MPKMKKLFLFIHLITLNISFSQISTSIIPISETYSSNREFELKSISYDDEFPNLKGESFIYYTEELRPEFLTYGYTKIHCQKE